MANRIIAVSVGIFLMFIALAVPSSGFPTGVPLSLTIEPGTIRQKSGKETAQAIATVLLKEPSPAYFTCILRSEDGTKVNFPTIIFHKGDRKATSEGVVYWKEVRRETRLRVSAYNADAPDQRLTFTVTLVPAEEMAPGLRSTSGRLQRFRNSVTVLRVERAVAGAVFSPGTAAAECSSAFFLALEKQEGISVAPLSPALGQRRPPAEASTRLPNF